MSAVSAIYVGSVVHARHRPKRHRLAYKVFSVLVDLDELPEIARNSKLLGFNRPGLFSIREHDHGDGGPLRPWVARRLAEAGLAADGPIRMLCYPRILGYVFNPLTVFFCHAADGALVAILYEVHNTHQERHAYVLPANEREPVRHSCRKTFFVSPFMPMDCTYHFRIESPGERVVVAIEEDDVEGRLLSASFAGRRQPLTDANLARLLLSHPLMTLKVTVGIHWEAVRLLLKGMRVYPHIRAPRFGWNAKPPALPVSTHHAAGDGEEEPIG